MFIQFSWFKHRPQHRQPWLLKHLSPLGAPRRRNQHMSHLGGGELAGLRSRGDMTRWCFCPLSGVRRGFSPLADWNHLGTSKSYPCLGCSPRPAKSEPLEGDAGSRMRQSPQVIHVLWVPKLHVLFSPKFKWESASLYFPLPEICNKKNKTSKSMWCMILKSLFVGGKLG